MNIYFGVDGTDNDDPTNLANVSFPAQLTSHVKRICLMGFDRHQYIGGPADRWMGWDTVTLGEKAVKWVTENWACGPSISSYRPRVYLGGFSRGGAAVIYAAHKLGEAGIDVQGLFLFDAVDRSRIPNGMSSTIPKTVKKPYHAVRMAEGGSRKEFGNCGMAGTNGNLVSRGFYTTHGGVGGWRLGSERLRGTAYFSDPSSHANSSASSAFSRQFYHEHLSPSSTKINAIQQLSGSMAVWNWMEENIKESLQK